MATAPNYFMQFIGDDFQKYVIDKFTKLVPGELQEVITEHLIAETAKSVSIASIMPRLKRDGSLDRRYSTANMVEAGITGAAEDLEKSFDQLNLVSRDNEGELIVKKAYFDKIKSKYHRDQRDLFTILQIDFNDDNWMMIYEEGNDRLAECRELAETIDNLSIDEMRQYPPANPNTSFTKSDAHNESTREKIKLCRKVIVGRACVHACSKNNMMTKKGWKMWQRHALILGSLTVYYVMLQMRHFRICGKYMLVDNQ